MKQLVATRSLETFTDDAGKVSKGCSVYERAQQSQLDSLAVIEQCLHSEESWSVEDRLLHVQQAISERLQD